MLNFSLEQWQTQNVLGAGAKKKEKGTSCMTGAPTAESRDIFKIKRGHFNTFSLRRAFNHVLSTIGTSKRALLHHQNS